MLKAMVCDDEYIVLEGLKNLIDWSSHNVELIGTSNNGLEALTLYHTHKPDIIFTDIRMPGCTGLEFIEKVLKESPETICIVFSGFNDVDYLKKAIKLGVIDYLEKPITIEMVEEVLQRCIKICNNRRNMESKIKVNKSTRLERATMDILYEGNQALSKWEEAFGVNSNQIVGLTALAYDYKEMVPFIQQSDEEIFVQVRNENYRCMVIYHMTENFSKTLNKIRNISPEITFGVGHTYTGISSLDKSYNEAIRALKYGIFNSKTGFVYFDEMIKSSNVSINLDCIIEPILLNLKLGRSQEMNKHVNEFIQQLYLTTCHLELIESEILKLVYLCLKVAEDLNLHLELLNKLDYFPQQEIRQLGTREEMFNWLNEQMGMILTLIKDSQLVKNMSQVDKARLYIETYYYKDLTLQEVAEYVGLNSTYFSVLFKEKVGMSYIKYLTQIRMEQAKKLLSDGQKVTEVSEKVGYHSYRHFSETFRKYFGGKPGDYRKQGI